MSRIAKWEGALVEMLQNAYSGGAPYITTEALPDSAEGEEDMEQQAKNRASAGKNHAAIYICYGGRRYQKEGAARLYNTDNEFIVLLFSKFRRHETKLDIYTLLEKTLETLYKNNFTLVGDSVVPVRSSKTGLYKAVIIAGITSTYPEI